MYVVLYAFQVLFPSKRQIWINSLIHIHIINIFKMLGIWGVVVHVIHSISIHPIFPSSPIVFQFTAYFYPYLSRFLNQFVALWFPYFSLHWFGEKSISKISIFHSQLEKFFSIKNLAHLRSSNLIIIANVSRVLLSLVPPNPKARISKNDLFYILSLL